MRETEELSRLVGDIYDTTLDRLSWPHVLKRAAGFVGGPSAALWSKDCASKAGSAAYMYGFESDCRDRHKWGR